MYTVDHLWPETPAHAARPAFGRRDRTEQEGRQAETGVRDVDILTNAHE